MSHYSSQWLKVSEPHPHVLLVQLARPPVNAFNSDFWKAYGKLFENLIEDGYDVRALVIASGLESIFTGGLDIKDATTLNQETAPTTAHDAARTALSMHKLIHTFQQAITVPERAPFPVIAAVHGPVIGLGVDILCSCDIRYSAESATFAIKEVDIGMAADIGSLALLPKITGNHSLARELAYTARTFSPTEAAQLGLISRIVPGGRDEVISAALGVAKAIAEKSPIGVSGTKKLITHARDHSVRENLEYTQTWNAHALLTDDMKEAIGVRMERREPKFAPLKVPSKL